MNTECVSGLIEISQGRRVFALVRDLIDNNKNRAGRVDGPANSNQ
jgi:hypothetical protein